MAQWKNTKRHVCAFERVLRSVPLSKQPSFVKLFRLSAHLPARFSVSYPSLPPPPPLCSHVPWFSRIGPAEPILSQLLRAFVGSCLLWPGSRVERSSSAPPPPSFSVLLRTNASPSLNSAAIGRSGGRRGGVLLFSECIQVASGPSPECWPTLRPLSPHRPQRYLN